MISSYEHSIVYSRKLRKALFRGCPGSHIQRFWHSQYSKLQKLSRSKVWLILFHIIFFIYFFMLCDRWKLKALVLLLMFPAGLLIFLSSLIPDPPFRSISQLMPLLAWLYSSSVAPVATTRWGTALWVLSRKALCFIDLDFNFKC